MRYLRGITYLVRALVDPHDVRRRISVDVADKSDGGPEIRLDALRPRSESWTVWGRQRRVRLDERVAGRSSANGLQGELTADFEGLERLGFSHGIVHLALDDGVVQLPRDVPERQFGRVVAFDELVVDEPFIRHVRRIGVRFARQ